MKSEQQILDIQALSDDWIYLPMGSEALPLLKKGVVALERLADIDKPWLHSSLKRGKSTLSDDDYINHMQREFERLPVNLQAMISFEQFLQQAQSKRQVIERQLMQQQQQRARNQQQQRNHWSLVDFFHNPFCALSWQLSKPGWQGIWLAIAPSQWLQDARYLQPLTTDANSAVREYQRLFVEPEGMVPVPRSRLIHQPEPDAAAMTIGGRGYDLLRLPPKALRMVLLGHQLDTRSCQQFQQFWRSDFRYQRTPLVQMVWPVAQPRYHFRYL